MTLATLLLSSVLVSGGNAPVDRYAAVLAKNVANGRVDYQGVAAMRADLDLFLEHIATTGVPKAKAKAMAFYIDAYNALVLRAVLDAGQPKSVLDVNDFFEAKTHRVAGRKVSLDQLEKEILNPLAQDPRTHMVLVCAARGCPVLDPRPYTGSDLERRLEEATTRYVRSNVGARVQGETLSLSKIFEWYAADFGGQDGAVAFVRRRLQRQKDAALGETPKVAFFDYDWRLNSK